MAKILSTIKTYQKEYGFFKAFSIMLKKFKSNRKNKKDIKKKISIIDEEYSSLLDLSKVKDKNIPKVIYFFWYDGMFHMPEICKMCIKQLHKLYSNDYKIVFIDKDNMKEIVDIDDVFIQAFENKKITIQTFSDILRFTLLSKKGGVWIDSTVFIPKRIEFTELSQEGFYTYVTANHLDFIKYKNQQSCWSSFLIASSKNHPISNNIVKLFKEYILRNKTNDIYFLFDIFLMLNYINKAGNNCIELNKENNLIEGDFLYITNHLDSKVNDNVLNNCFVCPQKLNWKIKFNIYKDDSLIKYIIRWVENEN